MSVLSSAIEKKLDIGAEIARRYANIVMDLFGFDDRIIDNVLEHDERQIFYMLEEEGILETEREEIILHDGRTWRIHYWLLKKNTILQYSLSRKWTNAKDKSKKVQKFQPETIYSSLPRYMWAARRL